MLALLPAGVIAGLVSKRAAVALAALSALAVVLGASPMAFAEGDELKIVSNNVVSDFPDGVIFRVTAKGPDPVEEIRVFLRPLGSDRSTYGYLDIQSGTEVSGEYFMSTDSTATHAPPGSLIEYSYEVRDAAGRVLRTEDQEFLYMDESLEWKSITDESGMLSVYYYGEFVEKRARTVLETSLETMEKMGDVLGIRPTESIRIVSYSNYRDMARGLPFRSQAVREDLQTEGMAFPAQRVLMVLASEANVTGVVSHEFTHILVAEAAGQGYAAVPAWLNEGLAEYGNIDQTPQYDLALRYAIFTRRLKPLWYLQTFGGDPEDITIGYGHGKSVVEYLAARYGEEKLAELMKAFRTSVSVDEALQRTYGFDQYGLDSEWRQALGLDPFPPPGELREQLGAPAGEGETPDSAPAPGPTPLPDATAAPRPSGELPVAEEERERRRGSCNASDGGPVDLVVLGLLAGPLLAAGASGKVGKSVGRRLAGKAGRRVVPRRR